MKVLRAAIYVRVSREEENKRNRDSINTQIIGMKKFCMDNYFSIFSIYKDENYSGSNFERPGFKAMLEDAKNKKFDIIVSKDLSRIGRNLYKMGEFLETTLPSLNIRLICVNDDLDTSKGISDEVIFKNFFNDLYIKDIKRKLLSTLNYKASNKPLSARVDLCFGYKLDKDNNWVIDEEESLIIKRIFNDCLNGISCYKIAKHLKEEKVMTAAYRKYFKYGHKSNIKHKGDINDEKHFYNWDFTTISYILKNKQYLGIVVNKVKDKEYIIENHHEAIIELEDFNKATDILSTRKKFKTRNNPLSNFVKCGCCGYAMCIMENISYEYYCCNKCGVYLRKNDVENIIKKEVDKIVCVEEPIKNKNSIYKERTDINRRISNLEDGITLAILSEETNDKLKELNNSISVLKDKLTKLENNKNNLFDINGNRLTEEEIKDYKKVAKILFSKGLFKRINKEIQYELIKI